MYNPQLLSNISSKCLNIFSIKFTQCDILIIIIICPKKRLYFDETNVELIIQPLHCSSSVMIFLVLFSQRPFKTCCWWRPPPPPLYIYIIIIIIIIIFWTISGYMLRDIVVRLADNINYSRRRGQRETQIMS